MAYSDFTLSDLKEQFQLVIEEKTHLFPHIRCADIKFQRRGAEMQRRRETQRFWCADALMCWYRTSVPRTPKSAWHPRWLCKGINRSLMLRRNGRTHPFCPPFHALPTTNGNHEYTNRGSPTTMIVAGRRIREETYLRGTT